MTAQPLFITPYQLITLSLIDSGVLGSGETAGPSDMNNGLTRLNWMLGSWAKKRWLVYHLVTTGITSTGAVSYTVGPGQNFDMVRPDRLEAAFLRQLNTGQAIDYPLRLLTAMEDYNRIQLKSLVSFPNVIFYDSGFPNGTLYPWPVPQASIYAVYITVKEVLPQFTALNQQITLPPEYYEALYFNFMERLRIAYRLPKDEQISGMARASLNVIRQANAQVPVLNMPAALQRAGPWYSILSDQPN